MTNINNRLDLIETRNTTQDTRITATEGKNTIQDT